MEAVSAFGAALAVLIGVYTMMRDLRTDLRTEIDQLRTDVRGDIGQLRTEFKELRAEYIRHLEQHGR